MQKSAVEPQERTRAPQITRIINIGRNAGRHQHRRSKSGQMFSSRACQRE